MTIKTLIVDDETELVRNIASYLASYPSEFEVVTAGSGEDGLEALARSPVDILLADVRLPGIDGIELVRRALEARPELKVVVMTAFGSPEMRATALREGAIRFIEKPVDLEELRGVIHGCFTAGSGWSGLVGGLDIFDLAQLLALSGRTKAARVSFGKERGIVVFENGNVIHASTRKLHGEEAFFHMAQWDGGTFEELFGADVSRYRPNISMSTANLIMEAARLRDEAANALRTNKALSGEAGAGQAEIGGAPPAEPQGAPSENGMNGKEEGTMAIKDHLDDLRQAEGFLGAAVFAPTGDMLEGVSSGKLDVKAVGMFANNALLNAQKATDQMGVGRGNFMQIRAPQAVVLMRCLNEATDFATTATGKAHFHTVVIMAPEGNVGMAAMLLDKAVGRIAEEVR